MQSFESNFSETSFAMAFPQPPRVGVTVQSKNKPDDGISVPSHPFLRPSIPREANPSFDTLHNGLGVGLFAVTLGDIVVRHRSIGVEGFSSLHVRWCGAKLSKQSHFG